MLATYVLTIGKRTLYVCVLSGVRRYVDGHSHKTVLRTLLKKRCPYDAATSTPKKRLLPFSGELGKIKAGSLCSAEHIYVLAIFCRIHSYTKLVLQNTQKSRKLVLQNTQKSRWS